MITFVAALAVGALIGFIVPSEAFLGASAELIAFITLIMAGLLPAMILTATAIRGDAFSTARVREYGEGLRKQLRFWAVLFLVSLVAVLSICVAKISSQTSIISMQATPGISLGEVFVRLSLVIACSMLAIVLVRLYPAYRGLSSLLELTIRMAEAQALSNDRSFQDALSAKAARIASNAQPTAKAEWPE